MHHLPLALDEAPDNLYARVEHRVAHGGRYRSSVPFAVASAALDRLRREDPSAPDFSRTASSAAASTALLAVQAVLDKVGAGVLIIDATGTLQFANEDGTQVLERADAITCSSNRLTFAIRGVSRSFEGYLRCSKAAHREGRAVAPLAIRVLPTFGAPAYFVIVSPLHVDSGNGRTVGSLLFTVMIFEPRAQRFISTAVLRDLYGLSKAECEVAQRLYAGRRPEQLGGDLGISLNTVRTHLKRIFEKCGVRSQAELLQLLALGPTTF